MSSVKIDFSTATAIVVANMIGTGVFTSLGFQVMETKTIFALLMLWMIGGVIAFCGALAYSELGAAIPRSGGEYTYLSRIYHPAVGFLSGWVSLIVGFAAPIALAAMALAGYVSAIYPQINETLVAATVVVIITIVHSRSLRMAGKFQNSATLIKLIFIFIFILSGFMFVEHQPVSILPVKGSFTEIWSSGFAVSLIFVSYAYSGWNASAYLADEIKDPQKNLPSSILWGTLIVMILYVLLNMIFLFTVPISEMQDPNGNPVLEIGSLSAVKIFGVTGGKMMSLAIALLLVSTISSMIFAGPRVATVIGEDLTSLQFFTKRNSNGIPIVAVFFQSTLALILIFTSTFDAVLTYLGFILSLFTTLTVMGVFILRYQEPELVRPFNMWGYPFTPLIYISLNIWILWYVIKERPLESLIGVGTLMIGLVVYLISKKISMNKL
jgi:APA family basic amino acid/polyamine antiporter